MAENGRIWILGRRYSEFHALHLALSRRYPVAAAPELPPKTYSFMSGGSLTPQQLEQRRAGLERYCTLLIAHRWAGTPEFGRFFQLDPDDRQGARDEDVSASATASKSSSSAESSLSSSPAVLRRKSNLSSAHGWLDELRQLQATLGDISSHVSAFERSLQQQQQPSPSAVIDEAQTQQKRTQIKRSLANVGYRLKHLGEALAQLTQDLSDGEVLRRQDLLEGLKSHKERLDKKMLSTSHERDRGQLLSGSYSGSSIGGSPAMGRRVLGVPPPELPETQHLETPQLVGLQQDMIQTQDQQLDSLLQVVQRQKEMGRVIGDELEIQNRLLENLDGRVDGTRARLSNAQRQADRLK